MKLIAPLVGLLLVVFGPQQAIAQDSWQPSKQAIIGLEKIANVAPELQFLNDPFSSNTPLGENVLKRFLAPCDLPAYAAMRSREKQLESVGASIGKPRPAGSCNFQPENQIAQADPERDPFWDQKLSGGGVGYRPRNLRRSSEPVGVIIRPQHLLYEPRRSFSLVELALIRNSRFLRAGAISGKRFGYYY